MTSTVTRGVQWHYHATAIIAACASQISRIAVSWQVQAVSENADSPP